MIRRLSIIRPTEVDRIDLFRLTQKEIEKQLEGMEYEIIVPTRTITSELDDVKNCTIVRYQYPSLPYFSSVKAWNYGIRVSKYDNIIFMSNEIMPAEGIMLRLANHDQDNVICQVFDMGKDGNVAMSLVNTGFRSGTPSMFFLAMFNRKDLEVINGFDERFIGSYAYEDDDFGARWGRAHLPFFVDDSLVAYHLWHPRGNLGQDNNLSITLFKENNDKRVTSVAKGLRYL